MPYSWGGSNECHVGNAGGIPFRVALPEAPSSIDVGTLADEQLLEALSRGFRETDEGGGVEASAVFARMREELNGA